MIGEIESAAPLHDVGKIAVSDTILLKPGKLTPEEIVRVVSGMRSELIAAANAPAKE